MALIIPCIVPLCFLGMTYDARTSKPGVDIFPSEYVNNPVITEVKETTSTYTVINNNKQRLQKLEITGDLSLRIKTGQFNLEGKGSFIKENKNDDTTVEILATVKSTMAVKSLPAGAKPRDNWVEQHNAGVLGTHFVDRIIMKVEMICWIRFECFNSSDVQTVKGAVNGALGTSGSGTDLVASGKLEKLNEEVKDKANLAISYYGTVPLKSIPNTIEGARELINSFQEQIEEANLTNGIPMEAQLTPLEDIADEEHEDQFKYIKNKNLEDALTDFEKQLDELRKARLDCSNWAKSLPYNLESQYEKEIGELLKKINDVTAVYYKVVWELDMTKGPEQLKPAQDAYDYDGKSVNNRYKKECTRLIQRLNPLIKRDNVAADTYIQWGNSNCTGEKTQVLYEGFAVSSTEEGIGGVAQYDCAPKSPEKGYALTDSSSLQSHLAGIRYTKLQNANNPFKGSNAKKISENGIPCAKCYSPDSEQVVMFSATKACPLSWEMMYTGYMMSSRKGGHTTQYVCSDDTPSAGYQMDTEQNSKDTMALTTVYPSGSLPSDSYTEGVWIPCVVCAMKSNQISF